jgi:uncharacterized membrane protein YgdD (TMEM256/DUF423 family)
MLFASVVIGAASAWVARKMITWREPDVWAFGAALLGLGSLMVLPLSREAQLVLALVCFGLTVGGVAFGIGRLTALRTRSTQGK